MGGVPLDVAPAREWRREDAGTQSRGTRVVGRVANRLIQLVPRLSPRAEFARVIMV